MTEFDDGPAKGQVLQLRRAPLFLRVVLDTRSGKGEWDGLDQLDDTPRTYETVYVYRRVGAPGYYFPDWTEGGRRKGGRFARARYRFYGQQPGDATTRDTATWRAWCLDEQLMPSDPG